VHLQRLTLSSINGSEQLQQRNHDWGPARDLSENGLLLYGSTSEG